MAKFFLKSHKHPNALWLFVSNEKGDNIWIEGYPSYTEDSEGDFIEDATMIEDGIMENDSDTEGLKKHLISKNLLMPEDELILSENKENKFVFEKGGTIKQNNQFVVKVNKTSTINDGYLDYWNNVVSDIEKAFIYDDIELAEDASSSFNEDFAQKDKKCAAVYPKQLIDAVQENGNELVNATLESNIDDYETQSVVEKRKVWRVAQEYEGNGGDPINAEEFDSLDEAEEYLNSLTNPDEWVNSSAEHYAFIEELDQNRSVIYTGYYGDYSVDFKKDVNTPWNTTDVSDTGIVKTFGSRESDAEELLHECHFRLIPAIEGEYKRDTETVFVSGHKNDQGDTGKYSRLHISDKDENQTGIIELRISNHNYNPANNAGKDVDGFISVVVANKNETEKKFSNQYSIHFDGGNTFDEVVEGVREKIQEIIDSL